MTLSDLAFLAKLQIWPTIALLAATLATMAIKREVNRWRFLFVLTSLSLVQNIANLVYLSGPATVPRYGAYFYTYWTVAALAGFAGIGVLSDVVRSIPLSEHVPVGIRYSLSAFALVTSTAYAAIGTLANPHQRFPLSSFVMQMDYCIAGLWAFAMLALLLGVVCTGLAMTTRILRITLSFSLQIALRVGTAAAVMRHSHQANVIAYAYDICSTCVYGTWLYSFLRNPDPFRSRQPLSAPVEQLRKFILAKASQP